MVSNKELEAGLKAMADDFHLPGGGRKKLSRLVVGYLWWFDAAEQRGMSCQDMIRAMTAAGVTGRGAKPISVGTLSSTVWRVRTKDREASGAPEQERLGQAPILPIGQPLRSTPRFDLRSDRLAIGRRRADVALALSELPMAFSFHRS